jgi:AcrR family transcriptional regulator
MPEKRKYELRKRAAQLDETRRRITEATVELHRTVGPAATQISEIARRAGVQRVTVYNHFPDESSLLSACSAHWRALHPAPDPARWASTEDPGAQRRLVLRDLYAWYRETAPMTANVLRDATTIPALGAIVDRGLGAWLGRVRQILADSVGARGAGRDRVDAATWAAVDLHFWHALAPLGDAEAAELGAALIELAAGKPLTAGRTAKRASAR